MPHVFDADGHVCEPPAIWQEYAEPRFRDAVLQVRRLDRPVPEVFAEGARIGGNPAPSCIPGKLADREVTWDDLLPASHEPGERVRVMREEGIERAAFFPSLYLLYGDLRDPEIAAASCSAYNRWLADFCAHDASRLFGLGLVPLQDPSLAVAEAKRLPRLGLRGLVVRPERFNGLALYDPACDPLWEVAQAEDLAVAIHGSFGTRMPSFATSRYRNAFFTHMICHPFEQMAAVLDVVAGGVLERFPRLRVGFFESGLGWLPYWLERMDEHLDVMGHLVPSLRRRPSEIFREQCFVSMEPDEGPALDRIARLDLARCVLWGSDYPHYDATYPGAYRALEKTLAGFAPDLTDQIVDRNPRRFLGLG
jgi:predicted TIM-barrel fold metal-dependent hydrolase